MKNYVFLATTLITVLTLAAFTPTTTLAYPVEPDYNFAKMRAQGTDCRFVRWFISEPVHDASGNTYTSQEEACLSGGSVFWSGPSH